MQHYSMNVGLENTQMSTSVGKQILFLWSILINLQQILIKSQVGGQTFACHCMCKSWKD